MSFSELAWTRVGSWYDAILTHPFIGALGAGTLPTDIYARYLLDDAHYLSGYSKALAAIGSRAPDALGGALFARSAAGAVEAEGELHRGFLAPLGIDPDADDATEPSPTCRAYVGTLQADAAFGPVEVAMAGVLPCFRVYAEVGRAIAATQPRDDHPYASWIGTYADPAFDKAVAEVEAYTDERAAAVSQARRDRMLAAYERATRFEWMFWDSAWRGEGWPQPARP